MSAQEIARGSFFSKVRLLRTQCWMSKVNSECKAPISPPAQFIWTYFLHTHQSEMNVKIEQKPLVDAAWIIITCCRSVNGGSTFSVCRSCNCNKQLFRLECYQKKKNVWLLLTIDVTIDIAPLTLQLPWSLLNTSVHNVQRIQGVVTVRGVSLMSAEEWCGHMCFYDLICDSWLFVHLDGVPVKSCLVIIFVYITRTSLFLIRDPLSVFASLPEEGWGSHSLYAKRTCTEYSIVLNQICILPTNSRSS